jgi:hypothetical protein
VTCGFVAEVAGLNRRPLRPEPSSDADCHGVGMPDLGYRPPISPVSAAGGGDSFFSRTRCLEDFMPLTGLPRMDETPSGHASEPP